MARHWMAGKAEMVTPVGSTSARESVGVLDGGSEPVRASETGGWNTDGGADAKVNPGAGDVALLPQLPSPNGIGWLVARRVLAVGLAAWAVVIARGLFHIYTMTNKPSALPSSVWGAVMIPWAMFAGAYALWKKY